MRKKNHEPTLGDIYGTMLKGVKVVVNENAAQENITKSKKKIKTPENAFTKQNTLADGGPKEKGGYHKSLNDNCDNEEDEEDYKTPSKYKNLDKLKKKMKSGNLSDKQRKSLQSQIRNMEKGFQSVEAEERVVKESKKIARNRLNNFMTKKSTFDKLFESVMGGEFDNKQDTQEADALGLGDAPTDDEFGDNEFEDEGEQVTVTMDRSVAQQLCDLLQAAMGGGEEEFGDDEGLDFDDSEGMDFEDEDSEEDKMDFDEDEERSVHPTDKVGNDGTTGPKNSKDGPHKLQTKSNKVGGRPTASGQGTKVVGVTDKVGNDGDKGHAITSPGNTDYGKQNKVSDIRQATDFFR